MAAPVRTAIVLSLGGAVVVGPEALCLLLDLVGRSPVAGITIRVFLICAATAPAVGTMLLARYLRVARRNANVAGPAPPTDPATELFAPVTLAVSIAVAFVIATCLLTIPSIPAGQDHDAARYACPA